MSAGIYDNINIINFSFQYDKIVLTCDYVIDKTWAADLYLIYKLEPKASG